MEIIHNYLYEHLWKFQVPNLRESSSSMNYHIAIISSKWRRALISVSFAKRDQLSKKWRAWSGLKEVTKQGWLGRERERKRERERETHAKAYLTLIIKRVRIYEYRKISINVTRAQTADPISTRWLRNRYAYRAFEFVVPAYLSSNAWKWIIFKRWKLFLFDVSNDVSNGCMEKVCRRKAKNKIHKIMILLIITVLLIINNSIQIVRYIGQDRIYIG